MRWVRSQFPGRETGISTCRKDTARYVFHKVCMQNLFGYWISFFLSAWSLKPCFWLIFLLSNLHLATSKHIQTMGICSCALRGAAYFLRTGILHVLSATLFKCCLIWISATLKFLRSQVETLAMHACQWQTSWHVCLSNVIGLSFSIPCFWRFLLVGLSPFFLSNFIYIHFLLCNRG